MEDESENCTGSVYDSDSVSLFLLLGGRVVGFLPEKVGFGSKKKKDYFISMRKKKRKEKTYFEKLHHLKLG